MALVHPRLYPALILLVAMLLCTAAYLPGLTGPWIFDDYPNIIRNSYIRIVSLDSSDLYSAAFSMESGPLRRPISITSFALNHYFADGFNNTSPFKTTNLVIHLLNTLLVFWLAALILRRVQAISKAGKRRAYQSHHVAYLLAACAALVWSIHPLQLTSILYVVQRMTELAATFTLLGLICYLYGREQILAGRNSRGLWFALVGTSGFGILGILSKENAALLPLFVVLLEFFLYYRTSPWTKWRKLTRQQKWVIRTVVLFMVFTALFATLSYTHSGYQHREFTLPERLITEARVLFFYISLLFVPDISRFGHQHDDITVSSSLFMPWTTLPSMLGIAALIAIGFWLRKRNPLLGLGILWFFTGHLMESTILPLEIAHEHRNYFPSFGFALIIASALNHPALMARRRLVGMVFAVIVIAFTGITFLRASQWSDHNTFYRYEVAHHPLSVRTQMGYSTLLEAQGRYQEAQKVVRYAITLDTHEAGYVMDLVRQDARQKRQPSPADHAELLRRLKNEKITATTIMTVDSVMGCLQTWCSPLVPYMEEWINTILERSDAPDPEYFRYCLGRIKTIQNKYGEALNLFQQAHEADRSYLHPLFEQINIFLTLGEIDNAEFVMERLKEANARGRYRRDREIAELEAELKRYTHRAEQP